MFIVICISFRMNDLFLLLNYFVIKLSSTFQFVLTIFIFHP